MVLVVAELAAGPEALEAVEDSPVVLLVGHVDQVSPVVTSSGLSGKGEEEPSLGGL